MKHVNYPHDAGYLDSCPACLANCHCCPGLAPCVAHDSDNAGESIPRNGHNVRKGECTICKGRGTELSA